MGHAKDGLDEAETRMFWPTADGVCRSHVLDEFLLGQLDDVGAGSACGVCGSVPSSLVDLDDVCDLVVPVIREYRRRAIDELYHDPETESGYALGDRYIEETPDVVDDLFAGAFDDELTEHVGLALEPELWFRPGVLWLEGTELYLRSWTGFRGLIAATDVELSALLAGAIDDGGWSHEAADGIRPSEILPRLAELFDELGVIEEIRVTTEWFRAVHVPEGEMLSVSRLGTAPVWAAAENRMNTASTPMFYGAADPSTATAEIGPPPSGRRTLVGSWSPTRPIRLLNLVDMCEPPSLYDVERSHLRWRHRFLADFAVDVSKPIGPHEHAEYRATQVLMGFLRGHIDDLDGIMYRSSLTCEPCCALDVDNDRCVGPEAPPPTTGVLQLILQHVADG